MRAVTMSQSTSRTALLGLAVVAALLLTSCSAGAGALAPTVSTDLGTGAAASAESVKAPAVGDVVPAGTELPKGQQAYAMSDGSHIVISGDEAVPDAVLADVQAVTAQSRPPMRQALIEVSRSWCYVTLLRTPRSSRL